jgi:hypothetical protein
MAVGHNADARPALGQDQQGGLGKGDRAGGGGVQAGAEGEQEGDPHRVASEEEDVPGEGAGPAKAVR